MQNYSEVAQLRKQIEIEQIAAKRGLSGLALVARHQCITRKMENIWEHFQGLVEQVGPEEAHRIAFGEPLPEPENEVH